MPDPRDPGGGSASLFDDELAYEGSTTVGTDLFGAQDVPDYPAVAQLGPYEILGRLARGGMAEIYLARTREEDGSARHVVVKRILTEMRDDPQMLRLFVEEGRIATRLYHPNVCHVYECGEVPSAGAKAATYMALEWVHGVTLRDLIRRTRSKGATIPLPVAVHIAAKVASALQYVHTARGLDGRPLSIIHQDVSPHNVMVSWKGDVKLLDFGIAKTSAEGAAGGDIPQGKYEYMSPEQVRGMPLDARSDIFALGIVLWEMLTCEGLFRRSGLPQTMTAVVEEPTPSVRQYRPEVPLELDAIVMKALAKRPDDRYRSAGEMQQALEGWLVMRNHTVGPMRVAASVGVVFEPAEKLPLPHGGGATLTGTLPALTGQLLGEIPEDAEVFTFDHAPEPVQHASPMQPVSAPMSSSPTASQGAGNRMWLWIGLGALTVTTMLGCGALAAFAALWYANFR